MIQIVGHNSDAPDVYLFVVGLHPPDLRSHIDRSSADRVQLLVRQDLADAEIRQLQQGIRAISTQE